MPLAPSAPARSANKGTTERTLGEVIVTRNEVALARLYPVDYAVVTGITLVGPRSSPPASGGVLTVFPALRPPKGSLTPLVFSMKLPKHAD
jgi:hypothetical protein